MTEVAERVAAAGARGRGPDFGILARRFYRHVSADDLGSADASMLDADLLVADLEVVLGQALDRPSSRANVLVRTESDTAVTVAVIVTDDMPFLVDSITSALALEGRTVRLVIHPQLVVRRDEGGRLLEVLDIDVDDARPSDALAESWMRIELERDFVREDDRRTADHLRRVLRDVRAAVQDWARMREVAVQVAEQLQAEPPVGVAGADVDDAAELLAWMADERFVFLGYREYQLQVVQDGDALVAVPGTGLGILAEPRHGAGDDQDHHDSREAHDTDGAHDTHIAPVSRSFSRLPAAVRAKAREPQLLILTKANSRSTVHRSGYLDYVGIKKFAPDGSVVGEMRFLGLFSAAAYSESIAHIPVLSRRYQQVMEAMQLVPGSHSARDLLQFLETYPREELFATRTDQLIEVAASVLHLQERRHTKLYVRVDDYQRFVSCLVYLPRDRYNTAARLRVERVLVDAYQATAVDHTSLVTESILARVHYVLHLRDGVPQVDAAALEERVAHAVQNWADEFVEAVVAEVGQADAPRLLHAFSDAFPTAYQDEFPATTAVADALEINRLQPEDLALELYQVPEQPDRRYRLKLIRVGPAMSLSRILPTLQALGMDVLDEHPYQVARKGGASAWILDFGLELPAGPIPRREDLAERVTAALRAAWFAECETDEFNGLVLRAGLTWEQVAVLRAYARYLRQTGSAFSQDYIQEVLLTHPGIPGLLVELFWAQFAPVADGLDLDREERARDVLVRIEAALDEVTSLDHDRILRSMTGLIRATLRTNAFADRRGPRKPLAFKLDSQAIPELPLPRPMVEIWVYSPRVEGVHLRFGKVARGGLRWSDRREDFRTEVLGLVKAQEVKNAVIVPVGAKGGFVPARLPDPATDREAWMDEGKACYREFIAGLLDLTDNLAGEPGADRIVPPAGIVRRDGDDPYLVVAADKGTATFSDIANGIAEEYGFWLHDAFASGGSQGYDHKAMGITAKGAWESVKRHFRELDLDVQQQDFTCIGIGDMSGDVFGNGMLLSPHTRLVAAFDHRDIFIDPDPDPMRSFAERERLFALPRSSWADVDPSAISTGGGVYSRSAKSVALSAQALAALGLPSDTGPLPPADVIRAILRAPVDLFWNGGIGTYVKARTQSHAEVGDKANDAIRVNADELRCRVVGEGGNLGLTQLGRVEAARHGVRLNTDAIDNSAGVDTSDHEVNIKILLNPLVQAGAMTLQQRNELLVEMTDAVAQSVLADNYAQNVVLGNARAVAPNLITVHQRMIREYERAGLLDRAIEFLPDDEELLTRQLAGQGLTSPELAVLLAYAKIVLTDELNRAELGRDPWYARSLLAYFPAVIGERFEQAVMAHPLRNEIVSTVTCNRLINMGGTTFVFRAVEETGASPVEVVHAASAAMAVFDLPAIWASINQLDNQVPTAAQTALHLDARRLLDRATRWFLQTRGGHIDVSAEVDRFADLVRLHGPTIPGCLQGSEAERLRRNAEALVGLGAPEGLARQCAALLDLYSLLDIIEVCRRTGEDPSTAIPLYFSISERYGVDRTLVRITGLPRGDRWSALARQALRSDLYAVISALTERVIRASDPAMPVGSRIEQWESQNAAGLARTRATLDEISEQEEADLATLSVALRVMRNLVA